MTAYSPTEAARLIAEAAKRDPGIAHLVHAGEDCRRCDEVIWWLSYGQDLADQLEAAQAEIETLRDALIDLYHEAGRDWLDGVHSDTNLAALDRADQALKAATRETITLSGGNVAILAALRAILPVYRAACEWHDGDGSDGPHRQLENAVDTARAAITPDIAAALERAGLES